LREEDIRSLKVIDEVWDQEHKWMNQFFDKNGLIKNEYTTIVACPCCGNKNFERFLTKWGFKLVKCKKCLTIYANPRFKPEMLELYYKSNESRGNYQKLLANGKAEKTRINSIFLPRKQYIKKQISLKTKKFSKVNLLDIGCASGQFLSTFSPKECRNLYGVEPSTKLAKIAEKIAPSAKIINLPIEQCNFESNYFDVITMWEVLEHMFDPYQFLKNTIKILKKRGFFFATFPNIEGFDIQILWDKGEAFSPPSHLNYFRKSTITKLFYRVGLEIVEITTPGELDTDIVKNRINRHPDITKRLGTYFSNIIKNETEHGQKLRNELQKFIKENELSSNMMITAYKK